MKKTKNKGFIQIVIIVLGALIILKYIYDIDVVGYFTEGWFRGVLDKIYELASGGWEKYKDVIMGAWNFIVEIIKKLIAKF